MDEVIFPSAIQGNYLFMDKELRPTNEIVKNFNMRINDIQCGKDINKHIESLNKIYLNETFVSNMSL